MKKIVLALTMLGAVLLAASCTTGLIYTHTRQPLTLDMHKTVIVPTEAAGDIKHIQFPYVGVAWDSAAIGDIAKKHGLKEVSYADLETLRVLGIWNQYTVHVYGQ